MLCVLCREIEKIVETHILRATCIFFDLCFALWCPFFILCVLNRLVQAAGLASLKADNSRLERKNATISKELHETQEALEETRAVSCRLLMGPIFVEVFRLVFVCGLFVFTDHMKA